MTGNVTGTVTNGVETKPAVDGEIRLPTQSVSPLKTIKLGGVIDTSNHRSLVDSLLGYLKSPSAGLDMQLDEKLPRRKSSATSKDLRPRSLSSAEKQLTE